MLAWFKFLASTGETKKNAERTLVLLVLGTCLVACILFYFSGASPQWMLPLGVFLTLAIILALRGYAHLAGLFAPLTGMIIVSRMIFENHGIRDTAILGLPVIIIAASLMNGRQGTIVFGAISVLVIIVRGVAESSGLVLNRSGLPNTTADYLVVSIVIVITVALQLAVIERLRESARHLQRELAERQRAEDTARLSEERYRLIAEISNDYVFSSQVDRDGTVTTKWLAGAFESISGYSTDEFLARGGWRSIIHPDDLARDDQDMAILAANQKVISEVRVIAKDGAIRWVRVFARPVWDASENRLIGIHGAAQNITDQKTVENALRESQERYRTFIAQSTEGIRRYDLVEPIPVSLPEDEQVQRMLAHMYIAECNDTFAHMYGLQNAEQLLGKRLADLNLQQDPNNLLALHDFVRSGYRAQNAEAHEVDFQGNEHYYLVNTIGIVESGNLVRAWGIQRDVTEAKHAEAEIRQLNEQLEKRVAERTAELEAANKELESFSYSVSHDLRAPLRGINGFGEILMRDFSEQIDPMGRSFLEKIVASAHEMSELVDSLLEFSRLGRNKLRSAPVDLSAIATSVFEQFQKSEPTREVRWQVAPDMRAFADETLIRNVLENLLGNSWKYTSKTSDPQILFGAQPTDGPTIYFVQDNGAGFDMQYAGKLFGTFQRLHRADEFPGHGIGLANVQRIIHRHGGKVWAYGEPNKGATFYFTLPPIPE